jgi:4a-hydroxytetrahydrobiopterin dehydratase
MFDDTEIPIGWEHHKHPAYLFCRFQFSGYRETRIFLDRLAALSGEVSYYPDISFGTTYANVTVYARDGKAISSEDLMFARRVSDLARLGDAPE